MSSNEIAVRVENLSKCYNIYGLPQDRLKQSVYPRLQSLMGKTPKTYYREFWALRNISLEVEKGETVGIIGRNGSGKSTLLQIICGTLTPTSGNVEKKGRVAALLELGSGFNPEFTGRENVYLNAAVLGLLQDEVDARYHDIVAFADIGDFIDQPVKMYSSGMVVRLAFAVQAMIDPEILIVDEALAVGDEKFQRKCFARLEELKSRGTSILFVSHSGPQIVELCERVLLLEQGERLMFTQPLRALRAYQKIIYAPVEEQVQLILEYQRADKAGEDTSDAEHREELDDASLNHSAAFDSGLVSKAREVYPLQGAEIELFQILDVDGQVVNILQPGEEYRFEIYGRFLSDRESIYFGLHIRSISGVVITGQRFPEHGKFVERVQAGQSFCITYKFRMILESGVYFVGGGVWSLNEPICLHRILDALMFRIVPGQKSNSLGYVDISSAEPVLLLDKLLSF
jgi:lipopolysaccharide transport system ATP-binding protein